MPNLIFSVITEIEERFPFYARGVGINYEQEDISRPFGHSEFQWIQTRKGSGIVNLNGKTYTVGEGQGMLLFPSEPHSYHAVDDKWIVDWIIFHGQGVKSFLTETMHLSSSEILYISNPSAIRNHLDSLFSAIESTPSSSAQCSLLSYNVLLDIFSLTSLSESSSINERFKKIEPVIHYINTNYTSPITLSHLAEIADITPQHLCTLFKKLTNHTVFEYINLLKVRKSKEYLLFNTSMLIKEVAYLSGFNDESYYCAVFRKFENMTPLQFRSTHTG